MKLETYLNAMRIADWRKYPTTRTFPRAERQYEAFRARILLVDAEKDQMIRDMAWLTYCDQVIDTQSEGDLIGPGNEYADIEDWIESYIDGLKQTIEHMYSLEDEDV